MMLYHGGRWGPKVILRVVALLVVPRVGARARRYLWRDGSECDRAPGAVSGPNKRKVFSSDSSVDRWFIIGDTTSVLPSTSSWNSSRQAQPSFSVSVSRYS